MDNKVNDLLDQLVLQTADPEAFAKLNPDQRALGALELFIGTITRSGIETFFSGENHFLYNDVEHGLELIGSTGLKKIFETIIQGVGKGKNIDRMKELQEQIVHHNFNQVYDAIRKYTMEHFDLLKVKLNAG